MIFEDDDGVVLEKEAGILNASLCVRTGTNNSFSKIQILLFFTVVIKIYGVIELSV